LTSLPAGPRTPRALAVLHRRLAPGARVALSVQPGADYDLAELRDRLEGAGFGHLRRRAATLHATREPTLPDFVARRLRLLVCGLNPSPLSAEHGVPFARPGNRFWPAALATGLVETDRDPLDALRLGVGFTDLVKRATGGAHELRPDEYARGVERLRRLVSVWRPRATCFVGLDGWRRAVDARAVAGWVDGGFAGRPAYLMPSTSGRNAHASLDALTRHLRAAAAAR